MATEVNITVNSNPNNSSVQVVNVVGELDESNSPDFEATVNALVQDVNNQAIIFNFEGLEFMSSKIIGYMASVYTAMKHNQRTMVLAAYNQTIEDILMLVGLNQLVTTYPTVEEALQATAQPVAASANVTSSANPQSSVQSPNESITQT